MLWFGTQDSTPSALAMKKSLEEDYNLQCQWYDADVHDKMPLRMKFLYPVCLHCGLQDRSQLATCTGCYLAHYCKAPRTCQKSDYARHKFFCCCVRGWILGQPYARCRPLFKYPGDTRPPTEWNSMSVWSFGAYQQFLRFWEIKCVACFSGIPEGRPIVRRQLSGGQIVTSMRIEMRDATIFKTPHFQEYTCAVELVLVPGGFYYPFYRLTLFGHEILAAIAFFNFESID
jgi:hypothetical protein